MYCRFILDSLCALLLCQFCIMTCGVFTCLAMVGRYIPGVALSYSAGELDQFKQSYYRFSPFMGPSWQGNSA